MACPLSSPLLCLPLLPVPAPLPALPPPASAATHSLLLLLLPSPYLCPPSLVSSPCCPVAAPCLCSSLPPGLLSPLLGHFVTGLLLSTGLPPCAPSSLPHLSHCCPIA
uniref:Uncharacterized protein n=1 Tax=Knipowitschia caucasica TaxID=637954 RepID=A0AAV2M3I3_KNICA